ncbi:NlpC/P60 family protein [Paenibacillus polymyxa]|uniref:NlpC/P60 family protein n=1 Tax=Paenibacillus polymyxa TaxID=1406 RepID=UPI0036F43E28
MEEAKMGLLAGTVLTFGNIRVKAPYNIVKLLDFRMEQKVNDHGKISLTAIIPDEDQDAYNGLEYGDDPIEVYESDGDQVLACLFKGIVTHLQVYFRNGIYSMNIQALSYTYLLDKQMINRSFQKLNITYYKLFREMIDSYPHGDFIDLVDADQALGEFTVQYQESDWAFLRRMASRLQTGLIAEVTSEAPRFWLGTSKDQVMGELGGINYSIQRTKKGTKYTYVEIEDTKRFSVGDVVIFQHKHWAIDQVTAQMKQGLLKYTYKLVAEGGLTIDVVYNDHLMGLSIHGKVIDRANEMVRLQLAMDLKPMKEDSCWFAYPTMYTAEGIGWHCMPELGDTVQLYFPSGREKDAYVIQSLRQKNHKSDEIHKPERKLFQTKTGKIARFDDKETALSNQTEKIMIRLNPATGIHVYSHNDMTFEAKEDLVLHGKKVQITATHELDLSCKTSYMRTDGAFHLKASKVLSDQVPDAEIKAYNSLKQELKGKGYPQWVQDLLLKYKSQYYKDLAAGDKKKGNEAAAKAKQIRQQVAEIDAMPAWARAQMHEYTAQWWDAHAAGDKARQNKIHNLANKLRDNVQINELIRASTTISYLDANRLEELSGQYSDVAHKLAVADKQAIAKEAAELRSKYGVGNLQARENLNKLARKYPDSFPYKLSNQGDWDSALNAALSDFAKKYGISNKGYSRDVLEVYLYQVANGILPWPKVYKKPSTPAVSDATSTKTVSKPKETTEPKIPVKEQPKPTPSNSSADEKRKAIVEFAKKFEGRIPYCINTIINTMILDVNNPPKYMDCSDFTSSVYLTVLNEHIGGNTRAQIKSGKRISHKSLRAGGDLSQLKKGDLILYNWTAKEDSPDLQPVHVGMYIGNGQVIHESGSNSHPADAHIEDKRHNVRINKLSSNWMNHKPMYSFVISVRRIIQD